jgi:uncharacterized SAM-binding protein YcdF (DUF218 family)
MIDSVNRIATFLARRDIVSPTPSALGSPVDAIVLCGSALVGSCSVAAQALRNGCANQILISGGIGHSTDLLYQAVAHHPVYCSIPTEGRTEAEIFRDILVDHLGVPAERTLIENRSTNCGANADESRKLADIQSLLLIQDPTMQRRSHASFERAWCDVPSARILSFSPFVPVAAEGPAAEILMTGDPHGTWDSARFISLLLGEIARLRDDQNGYGPKGRNFIDHIEIPNDLLRDFEIIQARFQSRP